jgi:hypothetical protein
MPEKVICSSCNHEMEIGDYPFCPHESIYVQNSQGFDPVVIHKDAQGNVRFPGSANAPCPPGFQRVELTNVSQIRKLEREVNAKELSRAEGNRQAQKAQSEGERMARREKFKEIVRNFSPKGKRFAEDMMKVRDQRQGRLDKRITDMGFHVEAFSQNSSNREAHNDAVTGWRGRKS